MSDGDDDDFQIKIPNEKMLEEMIIEEEKRRMSNEYRDKCTEVKDIVNGWLEVTAQMQIDVVSSFGFTNKISCDIVCNMMRRAHILYPHNEIFKTVPLQVRNNKATQGTLTIGDVMPEFDIVDIVRGNACSLSSLIDIHTKKPSVIIMSSAT